MYHEINQLHYGIAIEREETLFKDKSPYQEVEIFKSKGLGNVLTLDGLAVATVAQ